MRVIDPAIEILDGTDVDDAWRRFEVFEALHHPIRICNPMSSAELDEVVDALGLTDGDSVLDVGCGYGELLFRCADRADITGIGIDESPWMLATAVEHAAQRVASRGLHWVLGDARDYRPPTAPTVGVCIGAEWVWHDFNGTVRALAERVAPGGAVVVGAARLHEAANQAAVQRQHGHIDTVDDMREMLLAHGLTPRHRVDPDDDGWDRYLAQTAAAAQSWAVLHPGPRADQWIEEQADWQAARDRDREIIGWSLWIAHKAVSAA